MILFDALVFRVCWWCSDFFHVGSFPSFSRVLACSDEAKWQGTLETRSPKSFC